MKHVMNDSNCLTNLFEENRPHLRSVASRMLGSATEAEDAVQEAWLKLNRLDTCEVENPRGWLATVVTRVCLDMLRTRRSRREEPLEEPLPVGDRTGSRSLEDDLILADVTGQALLVVVDTLSPVERVVFVLHDMFDLSFEEIARIVNRTPAAARQIASRARRRVRAAEVPAVDIVRHRELVRAFFTAARCGDYERLLAVLSPEVVLRADETAVRMAAANRRRGAPELAAEVQGASHVAKAFERRAHAALPALIDGTPGAVWRIGGQVRAAFVFRIESDEIIEIEIYMHPEHLAHLDVQVD